MSIRPADRIASTSEYYFSSKLREVRALKAKGHSIVNLAIGSPDLPPHPSVTERLAMAAQSPHAHGYQPYQGLPELTDAIRTFYQKHYQTNLDHYQILPLMGSKEGIMHVSMAFLNPGDTVLVPALSYPTYRAVAHLVGAKVVEYPLLAENGWEPDWEYLDQCDAAKLIWINYPHMPTGAAGSSELLRRFVELASHKGSLLCHDNPYGFLSANKPLSIFSIEGAGEVSLELSSVSKTFNMAGWRVGWITGKHELIGPVLQVKSNMDSGMFQPIQLATATALGLPDSWFETLRETYQQRRLAAELLFQKLNCSYLPGQGGMFVWGKVPSGNGADLVESLLHEKGIFIAPGFIFGGAGNEYVRISLCADQSKIQEAIQRI